ncbi:hypothetical protein EDF44_2895 [Rathayibacter sp. PhB185]|nr:hypothetical protein EDF45_2893 [Rathayibacter sp. PhB186]ROS49924.1 hypothetical protein EDF44_2895 [Rathayibacter sp. PhB185]
MTAAELRLAETASARRNRRIRRAGAETASRRCGPPTFGSRYQPRLAETAWFREPRPESRAGGPGHRRSARENSFGSPELADPASRGRNHEPEVSAEEQAAELRLAEAAPARQNGRIPRAGAETASRRSEPPTLGSRKQPRLVGTAGTREPRPEPRAGGVGATTGGRAAARGNRPGSPERADSTSRDRKCEPEVRAADVRLAETARARWNRRNPRAEAGIASRRCRRRPGRPRFGSREPPRLVGIHRSREPGPVSRAGGAAEVQRRCSGGAAQVRAEASRDGGADDSSGRREPPQVPIAQGSRSPRRRAASAIACSSVRVAT